MEKVRSEAGHTLRQHIIVLRFSAMGDVLMTLPVLDTVARQNPDVRFTFVSRAYVKPLVKLLPPNVHLVVADLKGHHKGFQGLNRLARRLMALHPTAVADLHDVLRSQWLRFRMIVSGVKVVHLDKGRSDRRNFIKASVKTQQRTMFERYADVFQRLGLKLDMDFKALPINEALAERARQVMQPDMKAVAIAPFAAHRGKTYPLEMMEQVVRRLSERNDVQVLLFGAGDEEREVTERWATTYQNTTSMVGKLNGLDEELAVIAQCRVMVSMDSSNMHLAALAATPVVSIWGATHPLGGFLGYGQSISNCIQRTDLPCRPCSIYGQKPCREGDYPCLLGITPESIVAKIEQYL